MAVQVEGVGEGEAAVGVVFDEPVGPLAHGVDVNEVVRSGVGRLGLHDVLGHGLPVHADGRAVDLPHKEGQHRGVEVHINYV